MLRERGIPDAKRHPHPYLSGNFAPIQKTLPLTPCTYEGTIPRDLAGGQYVRNGGNPVTNSDPWRAAHWFDGDGMLSGVLFRRVLGTAEKGGGGGLAIQPEFVNQYVVTDVFCYAHARFGCANNENTLRRPVLPSIATLVDPRSSIFTIVAAILRTALLVLFSWFSSSSPATPDLDKCRYHRPIKKLSVANTAVLYHDGRALATCESGPPMRFALPSLETVGWFDGQVAENETGRRVAMPNPNPNPNQHEVFGGGGRLSFMKDWTTAHPRIDPVTDELIAFHSVFVPPFVYYSIVPSSSRGEKAVSTSTSYFSVPISGVSSPKMMHDFGVSRNYTIIMDLPLSLDPLNVVRGVPVVSYNSRGKSRFGVFPRYRPNAVRWFETNPCCIFHVANCWDTAVAFCDGPHSGVSTSSVHLLVCRLTSASLVFSAGNLPTPVSQPVPPEYAEEDQCRLYYYNFFLPPSRKTEASSDTAMIFHQWALSAIPFEFPTLSPSHTMRPARFVYGCSTRTADSYSPVLGKAAKIDILAKVDAAALIARGIAHPPQPVRGCVDERSVQEILTSADPEDLIKLFAMPPGWFAQEPRFVPRVGARDGDEDEDDGWLLVYVFDEAQLDSDGNCDDDRAASELWIIDARNMRDVVARVKLPQRVPYGLHGAWFPEAEIQAQRPWLQVREAPAPGSAAGKDPGLWATVRRMVESWIG